MSGMGGGNDFGGMDLPDYGDDGEEEDMPELADVDADEPTTSKA